MNDLGAVNRKMSMFAGSRKNGLQRKLLEGGMRNGNKVKFISPKTNWYLDYYVFQNPKALAE